MSFLVRLCALALILLDSTLSFPASKSEKSKRDGDVSLLNFEVVRCRNVCWGNFTFCFGLIDTVQGEYECVREKDLCMHRCENGSYQIHRLKGLKSIATRVMQTNATTTPPI